MTINPRATGSTAPTRATTSSCWRFARRRSTRTSSRRAPGIRRREAVAELPEHRGPRLLQVIADFTNFNVVTSDTVTGNVTLRLKDVPVGPGARHHPADASGLDMRKNGQRDLDRAQGRTGGEGEGGTRGKAQVADSNRCARNRSSSTTRGRRSGQGLERARSSPAADPRTKILSARGSVISRRAPTSCSSATSLDEAGRDPDADRQDRRAGAPGSDRGPHRHRRRQLQRSLGAKLGATDLRPRGGGQAGKAIPRATTRPVGGNQRRRRQTLQTDTLDFSPTRRTSRLPAIRPEQRAQPASFACRCSARREPLPESRRSRRSRPTASGRSSPARVGHGRPDQALIEQGTELPYQVGHPRAAPPRIQFRKANLKLEVTPQITPEGSVILT